MKRVIYLSNSKKASEILLKRENYLGAEAHDVRSLLISIYEDPSFMLENKNILTDDRLESDVLMIQLRNKINNKNYFYDGMEFRGVRKEIKKILDELALAGVEGKKIETLKLKNKDKAQGLIELLNVNNELKAKEGITLKQMMDEIQKRITEKRLDEVLKRIEVIMPDGIELNNRGQEKEVLDLILSKVKVTKKAAKLSSKNDGLWNIQEMLKGEAVKGLKLDESFSIVTGILAEDLVYKALIEIGKSDFSNDRKVILCMNYDRYAGLFYRIHLESGIRVHLGNGLSILELKAYELMIQKLTRQKNRKDDDFFVVARMMLSQKGISETEEIVQSKLLSVLARCQSLKKELGAKFKDQVDLVDLFFQESAKLRISGKDLGVGAGGISIYDLKSVEGVDFDTSVIIGIDSNNYPIKVNREAILDEVTRDEINKSCKVDLEINPQRRSERLLEKNILNTSNNVAMLVHSHDSETGKVVIPSPFFNQILNAMNIEIDMKNFYETFLALDNQINEVQDMINNPLRDIKNPDRLKERTKGYEKKYYETKFNEFDFINGVSELPKSISASSMKDWYDCPYRFYLGKIKGIKAPDLESDDFSFWLEPAPYGTLSHAILENLIRPFVEKGERDAKKYLSFVKKIDEKKIDSVISQILKEEDWIKYKKQTAQWIKDAEVESLKAEIVEVIKRESIVAKNGMYPIMLEEDLAQYKLLFKEAGIEIPVTGFIDRVDMNEDGDIFILDYKTGKNKFAENENSYLVIKGNGYTTKYFQHGLYSWAIHHVLKAKKIKAKSITAGYYFCTDSGRYKKILVDEAKYKDQFTNLVTNMLSEIKTGIYAKNCENCRYCDFKDICLGIPQNRIKIIGTKKHDQINAINEAIEGAK